MKQFGELITIDGKRAVVIGSFKSGNRYKKCVVYEVLFEDWDYVEDDYGEAGAVWKTVDEDELE